MHLTMNDNTRIYVNDVGEGFPVILIHGWPLNSDMWEYQAHALVEAGFRVISYDRRGFGRSAQNSMAYTYDILATDLHEIIEQLDLEKVALVGFSMGGGEIARYLGLFGSDRVSSAVLTSSITPFLLKTGSNEDGVEEKEFDTMIEGLLTDRPAFLAQFAKTFYGIGWVSSPVSKEILEWTHFLAYQSSLKACVDCVNAFGKTDFRADMAAFDIPTLIIHGSDDKTVPIKPSAEQAAKMIHHARLKVYEGAAHGLFITHKKEFTEDLLMFLKAELTKNPHRSLNESTISTILN